ncbi:hypothetical protein HHL22_21260 [Hymenobacter sp. RP-2-7]|uniref:DUF4890 domain-containing protein n=1 Tax=Hymenobacter polaris TaxID=2682546 RepID=A0A7Y0FP79_9BACT|nr:hypothetical protein [Hymenobacter polaris]NML67738.1 hypothetical protein [Hymenobacter polaris]
MKNLLLLALVAASALAARAQTTPATDASGVPLINQPAPAPTAARRAPLPPDQQADRQSQHLARALGLSAAQQGQVRQILLGAYQNLAATRQQAQATGLRRGTGRARKATRAQTDEQLRAVLTPDQYGRYQQLLAQRQGRRARAGAPTPGGPLGN